MVARPLRSQLAPPGAPQAASDAARTWVGVLGMPVDGTDYADATRRVIAWARGGESRVVCVATVNNVMEGCDDRAFLEVMRHADLVTPDGMPLVWALRLLGIPGPSRVVGAELTPAILDAAARHRIPVALFGSSPEVLSGMRTYALERFPGLLVPYAYSPPFRPMTADEEDAVVSEIRGSGARIVFVGLGCPKQEIWMDRMRGRIPAVMVGVGAAFDFLSGGKRRAPVLLQRAGLEWVFRLVSEPRRLWRRYLRQNPRFVALFSLQLIRHRLGQITDKAPGRKEGR